MVQLEKVAALADWVIRSMASILEVIAVAIIVVGAGISLYRFLRGYGRRAAERKGRVVLIRDLIFGLDLLVAADIIRTATVPDLEELLRLAIVVAVRVVLTFVLEREMREVEKAEREEDQSRTRSAKSDAAM